MGDRTEAACLLESGALYGSRVLFLRPDDRGGPIFAGFKAGAFSLYFGDEPILHFDLDGRWQRAYIDGVHYLRPLDGAVQAIDRIREGPGLVLKRRTLADAEVRALDDRIRAAALDLLDALSSGRWERVGPPPGVELISDDALRAVLARIGAWDESAWDGHRERHRATYGPLPFMPPDAQTAVVLQATLGHVGGVAYGLGRVAPHRVRTPAEFASHARDVAALLGRRAEQSRGIFLAGADVLLRPADDVAAYLETAARAFPHAAEGGARPGGLLAFLDRFGEECPGLAAWERFRGLGLRRVSLGVESGDPEIRALYRKTWRDDDLRATVGDLKRVGVAVNVLALADAGGVEHSGRHVAATAALIDALGLGPGDLVTLLDGEEVRAPARPLPGWTSPAPSARATLQARLREALAPLRAARGAKVAVYSLEKQGA